MDALSTERLVTAVTHMSDGDYSNLRAQLVSAKPEVVESFDRVRVQTILERKPIESIPGWLLAADEHEREYFFEANPKLREPFAELLESDRELTRLIDKRNEHDDNLRHSVRRLVQLGMYTLGVALPLATMYVLGIDNVWAHSLVWLCSLGFVAVAHDFGIRDEDR